jgi:hypothetical protein
MVARVTRYRGSVAPLSEGLWQTRRVLETKAGSIGVEYLIDTQGGLALTISLWESMAMAEASAEWARDARQRTAEALGLTIENVDVFDLALRAQVAPRTGSVV